MQAKQIKKIVIAGGGTAGWMAAVAIAKKYGKQVSAGQLSIVLIESSSIATVGVGEATVPGILSFHKHLGISEREFIRSTGATFKLGIEFRDWYKPDQHFFHPFSHFGAKIEGRDFYQCWLKLHKEGLQYNLEDFSLAIAMAKQGRFAQPEDNAGSPLAQYSYAYHFDAGKYAEFLRREAEKNGVTRVDAVIAHVDLNNNSGDIEALLLESGLRVAGDFFIDCSGFRALLIEQALKTPFRNWQQYLPCDRAVVVQSQLKGEPLPYTRSTAMPAGWRWQIPLQNRMGNGYVFSSKHISNEQAKNQLLATLEGEATTEPRVIEFVAGMREQFWSKNCVALGLASGFIEPLESTSISLIQTGIEKLLQFLPDLIIEENNRAEANRLNRLEYERIRDFIILHYKASKRGDSGFWKQVQAMEIPESLQVKLECFDEDGRIYLMEQESFHEQSWLAMYNGFRRIPKTCSRGVEQLDSSRLQSTLDKMKTAIHNGAAYAPSHQTFLNSV